MLHDCGPICIRIKAEETSKHPCPPAWNSLTHLEQKEWLEFHVRHVGMLARFRTWLTSFRFRKVKNG